MSVMSEKAKTKKTQSTSEFFGSAPWQKTAARDDGLLPLKDKKTRLGRLTRFISVLECLSEEELYGFESALLEKHFRRKEIIVSEEDTLEYMYFVFSGRVMAVRILDGKEHIIASHGKGDFFGEMGILDGRTAPATIIALENSHIGLIKKNDFKRYFLKNEKALNEILQVLCARLREAWLKIKVLNSNEAEYRIRAILKHIGLQHGVEDQRGTLIALRLTHKEISKLASLSRETVSRHLKRLGKAGEIEILPEKRILLKPLFLKNADLVI